METQMIQQITQPIERPRLNRLTGNERKALAMLLRDSRTSDVEIGSKLRVTPQAASKIRKKLERVGVIKDYLVDVNYGALGIQTFALALVTINSDVQEENPQFDAFLKKHLIGLYKILTNEATHIALFGFKELHNLDRYFTELHHRYPEFIRVNNLHAFPVHSILKQSRRDLFDTIVKEFGKEKIPVPPIIVEGGSQQHLPKIQKMSHNEKCVLKGMVDNSRKSYCSIARELDTLTLTSRGISKIKQRLEKKGIIKGYSAQLDYERLGIDTFAFMFVRKKSESHKLQNCLQKLAQSSYNIIGCYKLNDASLHVLHCGFRNLHELENYCYQLQLQNKELLSIDKIFVTSSKGVLVEKPGEIVRKLLH